MNIAYFGSPEISADLLEDLLPDDSSEWKISLVITQPDRPVGKRLKIQPTAVKKVAQAHKIPLWDKELNDSQNELIGLLDKHRIDICIVFAYGEFIQNELLSKPLYGFWNLHPSLLPLYRGPTPAAYALMNGDTITGVSLIKLNDTLDAGSIISQTETQIEPQELRNELEQRLTLLGSSLLKKELKKLIKNHKIELKPQDETYATYSKLLKKQHGFIPLITLIDASNNKNIKLVDCPDILKSYLSTYKEAKINHYLSHSGKTIYNLYRALTPWPGIWTFIQTKQGEKRLQIIKMSYKEDKLTFERVKLEGKNEVDFRTFNKAYNIV